MHQTYRRSTKNSDCNVYTTIVSVVANKNKRKCTYRKCWWKNNAERFHSIQFAATEQTETSTGQAKTKTVRAAAAPPPPPLSLSSPAQLQQIQNRSNLVCMHKQQTHTHTHGGRNACNGCIYRFRALFVVIVVVGGCSNKFVICYIANDNSGRCWGPLGRINHYVCQRHYIWYDNHWCCAGQRIGYHFGTTKS